MVSADTLAQQADRQEDGHHSFDGAVVAIGASAGGLDALERFFSPMPRDSGAAFVVIQHLSPDHKSMMTHLLSRHTDMPVVEAEDGMVLQANQVCLIPPASLMHLEGRRLKLEPKPQRGLNLPIDIFFKSLSEEVGQGSIGVILSGTGSDGTRGATAINEAGGFLLAQDPETARFDSMPKNAVATGVVDAIISPDAMAERITALIKRPWERQTGDQPASELTDAAESISRGLKGITEQVARVSGIDFSEYKEATVNRRIERRMQVRDIRRREDYLDLLSQDDDEADALRRELLIGVTQFFRDEAAFQELNKQVIEPLVRRTSADDSLRVWAAGVSTGEEVYSLAMLFLETFAKYEKWPGLKIFATDVNQNHIDIASVGQYPGAAAAELSPERVERFLDHLETGFMVKGELRQSVVFARHNLLNDPPFTRMDLVVCRNTLIYFKPEAQERALYRLQYALRQDGYLFLGSSESLSTEQTAFRTLHSKFKLFQLAEPTQRQTSSEAFKSGHQNETDKPTGVSRGQTTLPRSREAIEQSLNALVSAYAPPSILLNDHQELVHVFGNIQQYLHIREGWASLSLTRILPDSLVPVASALVYKCQTDNQVILSDHVRDPSSDAESPRVLRLSARPIPRANGAIFVLLGFEAGETARSDDGDRASDQVPQTLEVDRETMARVELLERELTATRESLQATIEELETSNEELQATNEELMASNEELQSSNEELQSVNEELNTVNAESEERIELLNQLNADLDSMARASGVATVFVDDELQLTRFSPEATRLFSLRQSDVGRRLDDFSHRLEYTRLMEDLQLTLDTGRMTERKVQSGEGDEYLIRMLPYETDRGHKGAVATFVDITAFQDARRLQKVVDGLPEGLAVLDKNGTVSLTNPAWEGLSGALSSFGLPLPTPGTDYLDALKKTEGAQEGSIAQGLVTGIQAVLAGQSPLYSVELPRRTDQDARHILMAVAPMPEDTGVVITCSDL